MQTCPQCGKRLTAAELDSGCCQSCQSDLPQEMNTLRLSQSGDLSMQSESGGVSVFTVEQAKEASQPIPKQGTVNWAMETAITSESELPEGMRTIGMDGEFLEENEADRTLVESTDEFIVDSDRTINMDGEVLDEVAADKTLVEPVDELMVDAERTIRMDGEISDEDQADKTLVESVDEAMVDAERTIRMDGEISDDVQADKTLIVPNDDSNLHADRTIGMDGSELPDVQGDQTILEGSEHAVESSDDSMNKSATFQSGSGTSKTSKDSSSRGPGVATSKSSPQPSATETQLNIPARILAKVGETPSEPTLRADYEIVSALGKGGMGEVWLARQTSLNREVALKQIRTGDRSKTSAQKIKSARNSFLAEAVVTGDLNHPNIVPVYDVGSDADGNLLYSMKVVRGTSWDRLIKRYPESENIEILRKVSDAIGFAHSRGVVHRDLKPSNIMVGSYGEVLVMDWGTALPLAHFANPSGLRSASGCAGTPAYMPPEQAIGDISKVGPHSDIYLLGAILFEIVTGFPPHPISKVSGQSLTTREFLENAYANKIVPTDASGELMEIALKAMKTSPADRYQKVDDFIDALKNYQNHAESLLLVAQAKKDLESANTTSDYNTYARSLFGFENALNLWDANRDASQGLVDARLKYAGAALKKEDFDLGLSLISSENPIYKETYDKLRSGLEERNKRVSRLRATRRMLAVSVIAAFLIVGVAALWINRERLIAQSERDKSVIAEKEARAAQKAEELATIQAKQDRDKAVLAAEAENIAKNEAVREWYYSQINLADQMVSQNAFDSAREILSKIEARVNESRGANEENKLANEIGWEFQRLKYVCGLGDGKLGNQKFGDTAKLTAVAVGNNGLATANIRGEVQLWTADTPAKLIWSIDTKGNPSALAFAPDGKSIAVGDHSGLITLWQADTGQKLGELGRHERDVTRLMFLPEGPLVSTSRDKTVRVWNVQEKTFTALKGHTDGVLSVARAADQNDSTVGLVTGDSNRGEILFWKWPIAESPKGEKVASNEETGFTALAVQHRGDALMVFAGTEDGNLKAIPFRYLHDRPKDPKQDNTIRSLVRQPTDRHKGKISSLLIDPSDPNRLISTSQDNTIRTWNIAASALSNPSDPQQKQILLQRTLRGHGNAIVDAAAWKDVHSGVTRLLTASADGTARLWRPDVFADIVTFGGTPLDRDPGAYGEILSISVGGNKSNRIMEVSSDGIATIWSHDNGVNDVSKSSRISLKEGHRYLTQSAVLLKDVLVTISFDGTAAVWDSSHVGSMLARLSHVGTTGVLTGSVDGRWVITGCAPRQKGGEENLQIWSLPGVLNGTQGNSTPVTVGKPVKSAGSSKVVADLPATAAISPGGRWGVVGTENGFLNLIELGPDPKLINGAVDAHTSSQDRDNPTPDGVTGVAFLSESEVASVGLDGKLRFWMIEGGNLIPHSSLKTYVHVDGKAVHRIVGMAVSADGRRIVTRLRAVKSAGGVRNPDLQQIWVTDIESGTAKPFAKLQPWGTTGEYGNKVESVSITSDGDRVLATVVPMETAASDQKQRILREWTLSAGKENPPQDVLKSAMGFHFQQAAYVPGDNDRITILSDTLTTVRNRTKQGDFRGPSATAYGPAVGLQACDLSQDGSLAVTVSDSVVPATDQQIADGKNQARLQGELRVWKVGDSVGERAGRIVLDGAIRTVAMSPVKSNWILVAGNLRSQESTGGYAAELYEWNGQELVQLQSLGSHPQGIVRSRFSADGERIVTASSDGQVQVFEFDGKKFRGLKPINVRSSERTLSLQEVVAVDLNHDGTLLIAADKSSALVIEVATGESLINPPLQGHSGDLTDVRFALRRDSTSPQRIWTTSKDGTVKFWGIGTSQDHRDKKANSARLLLTLRGHQSGVSALAALPNGGVVTGGEDGQVILWPIADAN